MKEKFSKTIKIFNFEMVTMVTIRSTQFLEKIWFLVSQLPIKLKSRSDWSDWILYQPVNWIFWRNLAPLKHLLMIILILCSPAYSGPGPVYSNFQQSGNNKHSKRISETVWIWIFLIVWRNLIWLLICLSRVKQLDVLHLSHWWVVPAFYRSNWQ